MADKELEKFIGIFNEGAEKINEGHVRDIDEGVAQVTVNLTFMIDYKIDEWNYDDSDLDLGEGGHIDGDISYPREEIQADIERQILAQINEQVGSKHGLEFNTVGGSTLIGFPTDISIENKE